MKNHKGWSSFLHKIEVCLLNQAGLVSFIMDKFTVPKKLSIEKLMLTKLSTNFHVLLKLLDLSIVKCISHIMKIFKIVNNVAFESACSCTVPMISAVRVNLERVSMIFSGFSPRLIAWI